jgi:CheY-like chemotaxis protein
MARILVADDNSQFAEMLRATLEEAGYEVTTVYSGLAAVAAAEREPFAAAVLDVLMPGVSGDVVAEQLHLAAPEMPVLLMTGAAGNPFVGSARTRVLHKPFGEQELLDALAAVVSGSDTPSRS